MWMHIHVCTCWCQRTRCKCCSCGTRHLSFWVRISHHWLGRFQRVRLAVQKTPGIHSPLRPQSYSYRPDIFFSPGFWGWNSGLNACKARTWLTQPSLQPSVLMAKQIFCHPLSSTLKTLSTWSLGCNLEQGLWGLRNHSSLMGANEMRYWSHLRVDRCAAPHIVHLVNTALSLTVTIILVGERLAFYMTLLVKDPELGCSGFWVIMALV